MIIMKKFDESLESERHLKNISEEFIEELSKETLKLFEQLVWDENRDIEDILLNPASTGMVVTSEYTSVKIPKFLENFFEDHLFAKGSGIFLYIGMGIKNKGAAGRYQKGPIDLYIVDKKIIEEILDTLIRYNQDSRIINSLERIYKDTIFLTLIHELTHAYDDYISSGKYSPKNYKDVTKGDEWGEYASQNLEVNARYVSTVANLKDIGVKYTIHDFEDVIDEFIHRFRGWTTLNKEQQERLIKRLYTWYIEPIKGKREKNKALKYIYNNASFKQLHQIDEFKKLSNSRVELPQHLKNTDFDIDVISYMKESASQLINGNYNKKEFNNPSIIRNRYKGFKAVANVINIIQKLESKGYVRDVSKTLQNQYRVLQLYADELDVSLEDLYTIARRFK